MVDDILAESRKVFQPDSELETGSTLRLVAFGDRLLIASIEKNLFVKLRSK